MEILELVGIAAFAVSGGLMAIERDHDLVGVATLAVVTALGGGVVRDLVLGDTPPPAFQRWEYLAVALAAAAVAFVTHPRLGPLRTPLLVFDAAGLGLFCVAGTEKALDHGLAPLAAALLGVTTAVGGGVLRDVLARETPALFRVGSELYALPAALGALVIGAASVLDLESRGLGVGVAVAIFVVRVLALRWHWQGPRAPRRPRQAGSPPSTPDGSKRARRSRSRRPVPPGKARA